MYVGAGGDGPPIWAYLTNTIVLCCTASASGPAIPPPAGLPREASDLRDEYERLHNLLHRVG
jgi:hypothetical protein